MLNHPDDIDSLLHALADPTRRRILERLGSGPASVSALAAPLPMTLPAVVQHLQVLEGCGLVTSAKSGRVRTCQLEPARLGAVQDWITARQRHWDRRLDRIGDLLAADPIASTTNAPQAEEGQT